MKPVVVIGGGPAGCQCALWLKMLGHAVIIIEQADTLGGLQASDPYQNNWMLGVMNVTGREFAQQMNRHIEQMDIPVLLNTTITAFKTLSMGYEIHLANRVIETQHIVLATGVKPRGHQLAEADNVMIGPGDKIFSYDFTNKRVAILGGGDNAYENYAFIQEKQPQVCHLYPRTIRARHSLSKDVNPKDVYVYPYEVDQHNMTVTQDETMREYDVIIVMYGWEANFPAAFEMIKERLLDDRDFIATDGSCRTALPGIYAIGEVANRMHPCVITAMADGVVAAKAIQEELER